MAHVYFADKKHLRKKISTENQDKPEVSIKEKSDKQSWGDTMGGVLKFIEWVDRYRIYRMFKIFPISFLNGLGHLVGTLFFGISSKVQRRIQASMRALLPELSEKRIKQLSKANTKYMGMFLVDVIFRLPMNCDFPKGKRVKYYRYLNFERLDQALAKGKGVIIPILHIGEHFHNPGGVFMHPNQYKMSVVASVKNLPMYEFNNRSHFTNLFIYASTKFEKIKHCLKKDLENNHTLVMYHDYSSKSQLRVPVWEGKYPYLIHTPQSYIRLHKLTGAEILPLISVPDKVFGKSKLFFLDNTNIMKVSEQYRNSPSKEFHGQLSTEINRSLYPYIRSYAPYWEEIMRFAGLRCSDEMKYPPNISIETLIQMTQEKMIQILDNSWEPDRQDDKIRKLINETFVKIRRLIQDATKVIKSEINPINLSLMGAKQEIMHLSEKFSELLQKVGEKTAVGQLSQFRQQLESI